ncbi:MAG: hypothetical protein M3O15_06595, partial [Acidobacteriota bacterium]|nr:hypothetical protein [Acidobacteriota bacterium]
GFGPPGLPFPWSPPWARNRSAPAPTLSAEAAPDLQVLASSIAAGKRHLKLRLMSRRGAPVATLLLPASSHPMGVKIDGHSVPADPTDKRGVPRAPLDWQAYTDLTLPAAGCELEMDLDGTGPIAAFVTDTSSGLPPSATPLLAARSARQTPIQDGDLTVFSRKVTF